MNHHTHDHLLELSASDAANRRDARVLWDYLRLAESPRSADILLVLGSIDDRVAVYAAKLSRQYAYEHVVISGGAAHHNDLLATYWLEKTEAAHFQKVYQNAGGDTSRLLLETHAQHTGDNARLSYELVRDNNIRPPHTIQLVTKPYMERRAKATFEFQWPDRAARFFVTSPQLSYDDYFTAEQSFRKVVTIMVGDYQRVAVYAERGLQSPQPYDVNAQEAFERLVAVGFDAQLIV